MTRGMTRNANNGKDATMKKWIVRYTHRIEERESKQSGRDYVLICNNEIQAHQIAKLTKEDGHTNVKVEQKEIRG